MPLCAHHRGVFTQALKSCGDCSRNLDTKQEEYDKLYTTILDNLHARVDPSNPDRSDDPPDPQSE